MKTFNKIIYPTVIISLMLLFACKKTHQIPECNYNIHIPDTALKNELLNTWVPDGYIEGIIDYNKDGEICDGEASRIYELYISNSNIKNIEGIQHFVNLRTLDCSGCNIESISISSSSIKDLECNNNLLTNLDVSNMKNLKKLSCEGNKLTELNLSKNEKLRYLFCENNQLTSIDVSIINLAFLHIDSNYFTTIDVSDLAELFSFSFSGNQISTINVSNNIELSSLNFTGNPISEIDLSNNPDLTWIEFGDNPMTVLDVSVNYKLRFLHNKGVFPFEKICVWTLPFPPPPSDPFTDISLYNFPGSFDGFVICD